MSKLAVTAAFGMIYLLTSEVSPTLVRNTSLGVSSICARVAGTAMPYLMLIGKLKFVTDKTLSVIYNRCCRDGI